MSAELSPSLSRRDDQRLERLQRAATWIAAAAALGLLGVMPEPTAWTGWGGLVLLALLTPVGGQLRLASLRKAPAVLAPIGLVAALILGWDPGAVVGGVLALLLVTEALAAGPEGAPQRVPLFALFAALLACTLATTALLAPLLLLTGLACSAALLLATLREHDTALRSRQVTAPRQLLPLAGILGTGVALAALAFMALPRHPGRQAQVPVPTHRLVGYAETVQLGELLDALDDPTPLFRVAVEDTTGQSIPGPFHFRGVVLDHFDGRRWTATAAAGDPPPSVSQADAPVRQRYRFEPTAPPILVGVPRLEAISVRAEDLELAANGTLMHRGGPQLHGYQAWSQPDPWKPFADAVVDTEPPSDPVYLELPDDLHPEILALAERSTRALEGDEERTAALLGTLLDDYRYQRVPPAPLPDRPLEAFLLDHHTGHCELFATSLALLLRTQGIPSRVVNGFFGGEWNPVGRYWLVRHSDAHAWVEAWLPGQGWTSLDPTPAPQTAPTGLASALTDHASSQWTHRVLALDAEAQLEALSAPGAQLRRILEPEAGSPSLETPSQVADLIVSLLMVAVMLGALAWAWRRVGPWLAGERQRAEPASGEVERALRAGRRLLHHRGWHPPPHLPPAALAHWLEARAGPEAQAFGTLAQLHYQVRYGGDPDAEHSPAARASLKALRALPRAPEAR